MVFLVFYRVRALAGLGANLECPGKSFWVPGELILGFNMSSFAVESEPSLRVGLSGSSVAVESELTSAVSIPRKLFGVVARAGKMRAARWKKSLELRAQEEKVESIEEVKRVERVKGTE